MIVLLQFFPDSESELILKILIFDEVKAYNKLCLFGPPCRSKFIKFWEHVGAQGNFVVTKSFFRLSIARFPRIHWRSYVVVKEELDTFGRHVLGDETAITCTFRTGSLQGSVLFTDLRVNEENAKTFKW